MPTRSQGDLVVVVGDDLPVRRWLCRLLGQQGYRVIDVQGTSTLTELDPLHPTLIVLDVDDAPDAQSHTRLSRLREQSMTPVIVLSSRSGEGDAITALDAGADDYVSKPFAVGELLARVRVVLRRVRVRNTPEEISSVGPIRIDRTRYRVVVSGVEVHLTPLEFRILTVFARHAGNVVTREQVIGEVWGAGAERGHHLRVHVSALRRKIERNPSRPRWLVTVIGRGYRLRDT